MFHLIRIITCISSRMSFSTQAFKNLLKNHTWHKLTTKNSSNSMAIHLIPIKIHTNVNKTAVKQWQLFLVADGIWGYVASSKLFLNTVCPSKGRRRITKIKKDKEKKKKNPTTIYTMPTLPLYRAYTYMVIIICQKIISTLVCTTDRQRPDRFPADASTEGKNGEIQSIKGTYHRRTRGLSYSSIVQLLKFKISQQLYLRELGTCDSHELSFRAVSFFEFPALDRGTICCTSEWSRFAPSAAQAPHAATWANVRTRSRAAVTSGLRACGVAAIGRRRGGGRSGPPPGASAEAGWCWCRLFVDCHLLNTFAKCQ